jgi:chaperonin GroES
MATATKKRTKVSLQPLGDKVVVERDQSEDITAGGIVLPDSAKDKPSRGTIDAPETIEIDDEEYLLMSETDILAVIE